MWQSNLHAALLRPSLEPARTLVDRPKPGLSRAAQRRAGPSRPGAPPHTAAETQPHSWNRMTRDQRITDIEKTGRGMFGRGINQKVVFFPFPCRTFLCRSFPRFADGRSHSCLVAAGRAGPSAPFRGYSLIHEGCDSSQTWINKASKLRSIKVDSGQLRLIK